MDPVRIHEAPKFLLQTVNSSIIRFSAQLLNCVGFCDSVDYSLPGFSVHGIFQAIILEWVAISFSRGSSLPRD